MNLYLLTRIGETNYDQYDSMVYVADSKKEAIELSMAEYKTTGILKPWVNRKEEIKCQLIGVAVYTLDKGEVISSYRAG